MARFQILTGSHIEHDPHGVERYYPQGAVFDSKNDLDTQFNRYNMQPRFRRLRDDELTRDDVRAAVEQGYRDGNTNRPPATTHTTVGQTLEKMTVAELKKMAEDEEIDVKAAGASPKKEDLLRLIRHAFGVEAQPAASV